MERVVKLDTLEDTCIPEVFKERTWTKLLNSTGVMYSESSKSSSRMLVWTEIILTAGETQGICDYKGINPRIP